MRIYLSGSISDDKKFVTKFARIETKIKRAFKGTRFDISIYNPANQTGERSWAEWIALSLIELEKCDAMFVIDSSYGVTIELIAATKLSIPMVTDVDKLVEAAYKGLIQ